LLDALTIRDRLGTIENLNVTISAICSTAACAFEHSSPRQVRVQIHSLWTRNVGSTRAGKKSGRPGVKIRRVFRIEEALEGADVVIVLRVQTERQYEPSISSKTTCSAIS